MSTLKVDEILKRTGTGTITLGQSGDTISIPSGATLNVAGSSVTAVDNTPYFFAERTGSNQTVSATTTTTIQYNTATINEGSCYDNSTYKFTPTTAGVYFFKAKMAWNSDADWDNSEMNLLKNSTSTKLDRYSFSNVFYNSLIVSATVSLTTSDSVYATIYQSSGGTKDILYGGWTFFTGWKLIA
tara:strand:+ start:470 stop:1024 length:555 start_codon:yes stop_codon:yes gene_type:complete